MGHTEVGWGVQMTAYSSEMSDWFDHVGSYKAIFIFDIKVNKETIIKTQHHKNMNGPAAFNNSNTISSLTGL